MKYLLLLLLLSCTPKPSTLVLPRSLLIYPVADVYECLAECKKNKYAFEVFDITHEACFCIEQL